MEPREKGLNLYFGYKLTEREMIDTFFDAEFRKYAEDVFSTHMELASQFDENNKVKEINFMIRDLVIIYFGKDFFREQKYKAQIKVACSQCCMYEKETGWIVGIKICHLPVFKDAISRINAQLITQTDIDELAKINKDYRLHRNCPAFFSIPSDCWKCIQ